MSRDEESFEALGASAELTEALAADGIERPTSFQAATIPVLARGANALLAAGPGSGLLVAWAAGLIDRVEPVGDGPSVLVVTADDDRVQHLAESLASLTMATGHTVAAIGGAWLLPGRADFLVATPTGVVSAVSRGKVSLAKVATLVVDEAQVFEKLGGLADVERVIDYLESDTQRIVTALPVTPGVQDLVDRHCRRAVTLPPPDPDPPPRRGEVRFRIVPEPREVGALTVAAELFADGARHVLLYCRSEDRAADVGDFFTLHGFAAGAPGDESAPVWLGVDALEARAAVSDMQDVAVMSCDAPMDEDSLDRRHAPSDSGVVIVLPREVAHLRRLGRTTGYVVVPFPPPPSTPGAVGELRASLERALEEVDIAPYLTVLEPLLERHDAAELAAAALALLRRGASTGERQPMAVVEASAPPAAPAWAKLFVSVGERDGLRPGDLVGAITGESGVSGDAIGKIEIRESHTLIEVHDGVARQVIRAINGTTIKGRAVRADFDRPRRGPPRGRTGQARPK